MQTIIQTHTIRCIPSTDAEDTLLRTWTDAGVFFPGEQGYEAEWDHVFSHPAMDADARRILGLPPEADLHLTLVAPGDLHSTGQMAEIWRLATGAAPLAVHRTGPILHLPDGKTICAPAAVAPLLCAIDRLNAARPGNDRMRRLARLQDLLETPPEQTVVRGPWNHRRVREATRIDIVSDAGGAVAIRLSGPASPADGATPETFEILTDPDALDPAARARLSMVPPDVSKRDWQMYGPPDRDGRKDIIIPSASVARVMDAVSEVQRTKDLRRAEPKQKALRSLETTVAAVREEDPDAVGSLDGLSDRVLGIGPWSQEAPGWLKQAAGIAAVFADAVILETIVVEGGRKRIVPEILDLTPAQAADLMADLRAAADQGRSELPYGDLVLATSIANVAELDRLVGIPDRPTTPPTDFPPQTRAQRWGARIKENLEEASWDTVYSATVEKAKARRAPLLPMPDILRDLVARGLSLTPHQEAGCGWLRDLFAAGLPGALLADDMGVGKTRQGVVFLEMLLSGPLGQMKDRPPLVVVPKSLLGTWLDEAGAVLAKDSASTWKILSSEVIQAWTPGEDGRPRPKKGFFKPGQVWLTTYETVRDHHLSLLGIDFSVVLLDEAQKAKNPVSGVFKSLAALKSEFLVAMTGTPVENGMEDLWTLSDLFAPGIFPVLRRFLEQFRTDPQAGARDVRHRLERPPIPGSPPLILRRRRDEVLQLPDCSVERLEIPMPEVQWKAYDHAREAARDARGSAILRAVQAIRAISLCPDLSGAPPTLAELARRSARFQGLRQVLDTARRTVVPGLLPNEEEQEGEGVLVFVERLAVQEVLRQALAADYGIDAYVLNGDQSSPQRQRIVREFQAYPGFQVAILSPKAAGVGLTLTRATRVVHLERWWNPAVEDQATARAHRLGQRRPVHVLLPCAVHPRLGQKSFDLTLDALLERKRQQARDFLGAPQPTKKEAEAFYADILH